MVRMDQKTHGEMCSLPVLVINIYSFQRHDEHVHYIFSPHYVWEFIRRIELNIMKYDILGNSFLGDDSSNMGASVVDKKQCHISKCGS